MPNELLPENGKIVTAAGEYFSASAIAALNIKGMPKTRAGVYKRAEKEGWPVMFQKGRGARDGVRYFLLPWNPLADVAYKSSPVIPLSTGSGVSHGLAANNHPRTDASFVEIAEYVTPGLEQEPYEKAVVRVRVDVRLLRERVGNNFDRIRIAAVSGDSMEPTLSHGDQVLVDISRNCFTENAIYAIRQGGHLRFKRIQLKLDGAILVKDDGADSETYTAKQAESFDVVGMVIPFKFGRFKL